MHIYPGGTWYHKVKHEDVPEIGFLPFTAPQEFLPWRRNQRLRGQCPNARIIIAAFSTCFGSFASIMATTSVATLGVSSNLRRVHLYVCSRGNPSESNCFSERQPPARFSSRRKLNSARVTARISGPRKSPTHQKLSAPQRLRRRHTASGVLLDHR